MRHAGARLMPDRREKSPHDRASHFAPINAGDRMFRIRVERLIPKDIETVFDAITDHAGYERYPVVEKSTLLEEGGKDRNGEGALRYVHAGGIHFYERITAYERPTRMGYQIVDSKPCPIRHDLGEITLASAGQGTRIVWRSEGHIAIPLLGGLLDRVAEARATKSFARLLECIERD